MTIKTRITQRRTTNRRTRAHREPRCALEALERRLVLDSTLVFNEMMYHPADHQNLLEWIELYNQLAVDVDISRWRLDGGIQYDFAEGTVVPGDGYLVIANDPAELTIQTGSTGALGPFCASGAPNGRLMGRRSAHFERGCLGRGPGAPVTVHLACVGLSWPAG